MKFFKAAAERGLEEQSELAAGVREMINRVRTEGDQALIAYNKKFEGNGRHHLRISKEEIKQAYGKVDPGLLEAMRSASNNLRVFAEAQRNTFTDLPEVEIVPGIYAGHRLISMDSCCCYVPGGSYPLFSSALMLAIPAKIAGVPRVVACSPAMHGTTQIDPATLVAMDLAGVDEIYAVGGAQAIAAFAYGTEQIKPVDLIVGPGNQYVTEAKRQCFGQVGIDFIAGPSEVLVIADSLGKAEIIAADLLAQAEHDVLARSILVTTCETLAQRVITEVGKQLESLPTKDVASISWQNNGEIILVETLEEAIDVANSYAPEHLEIMVQDPDRVVAKLQNYGSLFVGELTAEVFGDYFSGTNHTLPTAGAARYTGGVWVGTFLKVCTHQRLTRKGLETAARPTITMAESEGLYGHARSVKARESWQD